VHLEVVWSCLSNDSIGYAAAVEDEVAGVFQQHLPIEDPPST
jgi:hypothetical protein